MKKLLMLPAALLLAALGGWHTPASARTTTISWQGYDWVPRSVAGNPGAPQQWSTSNVTIDKSGRLHLKVTRDKKGNYTQAELDSARNGWGYGTYRWQVDTDVSRLAPEYVLGLFTYGRDAAYGHREIDIEASGWGSTPITWDYTTWANGHNAVARTPAPAGPSTQQIDWEPDHITWTSWDSAGQVIATKTVTGADVPVPYDESIGINLWLCGCESGWNTTPPTEVVLSGFHFTPAAA
jgi:beta-glucanase (GH16 family)